ncbi:MAG: hypothetical protein A2669_02485 [Candidatus Yanofskybacteria bacterium RIFCSPHIGHO2_01_FULL_48_25b]|uniref:Uncharacterized protein n=1 Tax=Candidatus Yanofskybacteria bacterium RIFCSPHIGHO2_01_FULL_48_25b TaxID=1802672 RepID=A0A1F8F468_9BACT|nr:MAG: hypothetical protein A2669_02485 [Candidatus Yanofskybacteria bacterium RIFCSPHIGHO2_01_FULL_48_25b]
MINWLADLIFPCRCLLCRRYLDKKHICKKCFNGLSLKKQLECVGCQRPTPLGKTCAFCAPTNPLDRLFVVSDFNNPDIALLLKTFKYRFIRDLAEPLTELTFKYLDGLSRRNNFSFIRGNPLLVPVPLHKRRENERGFNQAALLAGLISRRYRLDLGNILVRNSGAEPQANIEDREKRLANVLGLYACPDSSLILGRTVVIVDDICTTGATLNECARVLKNVGATHVTALVIARG